MAINNFNVGVGTTSQLTRYRYVATGGETSISGADADNKTLSYTVGLEQVFLNGVNLVRGQDYTATNGTTISNLTALVASDSLEVFAYVPFNIANAVTASTVDAKGDLLVGTAADTVGRLAVGTDTQLLSADSSTASGLKWVNPGMTLISTSSFSGAVSHSFGSDASPIFTSTYRNYRILLDNLNVATSNQTLNFRVRTNTTDESGSNYNRQNAGFNSTTVTAGRTTNQTSWDIGSVGSGSGETSAVAIDIFNPQTANYTSIISHCMNLSSGTGTIMVFFGGYIATGSQYNGFTIYTGTNLSGNMSVYGYNK